MSDRGTFGEGASDEPCVILITNGLNMLSESRPSQDRIFSPVCQLLNNYIACMLTYYDLCSKKH